MSIEDFRRRPPKIYFKLNKERFLGETEESNQVGNSSNRFLAGSCLRVYKGMYCLNCTIINIINKYNNIINNKYCTVIIVRFKPWDLFRQSIFPGMLRFLCKNINNFWDACMSALHYRQHARTVHCIHYEHCLSAILYVVQDSAQTI